MVAADIVNGIFPRQRLAKRQHGGKVSIIPAYHIPGHHDHSRLFRADGPQQTAVFFSKGNAVQIGKLQDTKAFKTAGQPRGDHTVVFGRQAPVAPPDQPAQHNYQCQDQY